ncbi:MAG TPA: hypothetical protein DDW84_05130 [Phycisphaerales bacterium]|nr:MAG: hypothetical protein A2Y13_10950 [Planctomycetes bacterium GWC2_45_44]HBG78218.1 hypothetical protein [Phycisphaerales bacterium]HBR18771.1 hypothetical protein [Phycisphaerales bacterium]
MENERKHPEEMEDLRKELENFQQEKERVRAIIGKLGGVPTFHTKFINITFIIIIFVTVIVSIIGGEKTRSLMIEIAVIALSAKIIYMIHQQMRVDHFKFWMLSSIEWRLNEIMRLIRKLGDK